MPENKKISDLEHQLIKKDVEEIKFKMHEGFSSIDKSIKLGFELIRSENKRDNDISNIQRKNILAEQKKTNGRVTKLEKVTSVLSLIRENKKIAGLVLYAIYNILEVSTIENVVNIFKWIKLMI